MSVNVWKTPPIIKVYEAIGSLADERLEVEETDASGVIHAKVWSSSGNKFYEVHYDPSGKAIMTNDNGSFWQGYLGYPALCLLMHLGEITFDNTLLEALKTIAWKDINQRYKNNFAKTEDEVLAIVEERGFSQSKTKLLVNECYQQVQSLRLTYLGKRLRPPKGY